VTSKFAKNQLRAILMKLGTMLEVDETFTTLWLSRSSEVRVKVRRWPQSPIGTIFSLSEWYYTSCWNIVTRTQLKQKLLTSMATVKMNSVNDSDHNGMKTRHFAFKDW